MKFSKDGKLIKAWGKHSKAQDSAPYLSDIGVSPASSSPMGERFFGLQLNLSPSRTTVRPAALLVTRGITPRFKLWRPGFSVLLRKPLEIDGASPAPPCACAYPALTPSDSAGASGTRFLPE